MIVELGSGPGFAKLFLPRLLTSDMVKAAWHDYEIDATGRWPFEDGVLDGVVMFDVLHHLADPLAVFREARRTLRMGGRVVLMEPYISTCSFPVLKYFHPEDVDTTVDPFKPDRATGEKDPFAGNQALPSLIFERHVRRFEAEFPDLIIRQRRLYAGFSYIASGGFRRRSLVPHLLWQRLFWLDRHLPEVLGPLVAFRVLVVLERSRGGRPTLRST